jgi:para-nitrobenzyl esterase
MTGIHSTGIRYAAAPIGQLRFAPPQAPPVPSHTTQLATVMGSRCPQSGSVSLQDEDCLFLNIQRPRHVPLARKLPVLVFFHGGGFESGSGNDNDPTALLEIGEKYKTPVLIVRISYRLALFGFLASSQMQQARDDNPNNVGLNLGFRDMKAAVEWVSGHIGAFGGDASQITIWGQSAGCVHT